MYADNKDEVRVVLTSAILAFIAVFSFFSNVNLNNDTIKLSTLRKYSKSITRERPPKRTIDTKMQLKPSDDPLVRSKLSTQNRVSNTDDDKQNCKINV